MKRKNIKMKAGDKILWNSGYGYDIGYYKDDKGLLNTTCLIHLNSGPKQGDLIVKKQEVILYSDENKSRLKKLYGYDK